MTDKTKDFEQQVLFDEVRVNESAGELETLKQQVIIDSDEFFEQEQDESAQFDDKPVARKTHWLWRIGFSLLSIIIIVETFLFFQNGFNEAPIIASLYAGLLAVLGIIVTRAAFRELKALRALKSRDKLRQSIVKSSEVSIESDARSVCDNISAFLPGDHLTGLNSAWSESIPAELNDKEVYQAFSANVLSSTDKSALNKVAKFSSEATVLIALSPIAIVDMGLLFWRNLKMIDEISQLYGLKLGYWARIKLIKQVFVNMVYAGATELIADVGADLVGADLLGKLSTRLAQGLGAGMLTARLGVQTMRFCRPIPFDEQNNPKIKDVRKQLVAKIKSLAKSS